MSQATVRNGGVAVTTPVDDDTNGPFAGWKTYPASLLSFNDVLWDTERVRRDLLDQTPFLFSNEVNLKVTDIDRMYFKQLISQV